jgi:hypothetical protein
VLPGPPGGMHDHASLTSYFSEAPSPCKVHQGRWKCYRLKQAIPSNNSCAPSYLWGPVLGCPQGVTAKNRGSKQYT